jgi:hypothetical protein
MSAFGGKADMAYCSAYVRFLNYFLKNIRDYQAQYLLMIVNGRGEQFDAPISCRFGDH